MNNRNALGAVVSVLREQAGLTQKELEVRTGLPQWRFSKLERGLGSEDQRVSTLECLAPLLGLPVPEIVEKANEVVASCGNQDPEHPMAMIAAKRACGAPLAPLPEPSVGELIETQLRETLKSSLGAEAMGRTVAQLANALQNYEHALYLRFQRQELQRD